MRIIFDIKLDAFIIDHLVFGSLVLPAHMIDGAREEAENEERCWDEAVELDRIIAATCKQDAHDAFAYAERDGDYGEIVSGGPYNGSRLAFVGHISATQWWGCPNEGRTQDVVVTVPDRCPRCGKLDVYPEPIPNEELFR